MTPRRQTAVVIGGGLGGLAVALRLAAAGRRVVVCEAGPALGGKMNRWSSDGFVFDTGPSLITMPWVFADLFRTAGSRMEDHLRLERLDPLARYVFADGTAFEYGGSMPAWLETVRQLEPKDVAGFWSFMHLGARIFDLSTATFFRRTPFEPPDRQALRALMRMPLRGAWGNYHATVARHFRSPHLRQLYDRYPTYVGSSPYAAPATLAIIPYIEMAFGGWYVHGGLYRIVDALMDLCAARGVELRTNAPVVGIDCRDGRVCGVELADGEHLAAGVVVTNGDASDVPRLLKQPRAGLLPAADRSMSGVVFLAGIRRSLPEVAHHAVYFSADYRQEFDDIFERRVFPEDPTVYVNVSSRTDRTVAPDGAETLFVMANAPANDGAWSDGQTADARRRVFERLTRGGFPDVAPDTVTFDTWTPTRLAERYGAPGGAIYGTHSHGWRRAFRRPPNKDPGIGGLYYVGGSTHPGGGTPTVLMSARITADLVERHEPS